MLTVMQLLKFVTIDYWYRKNHSRYLWQVSLLAAPPNESTAPPLQCKIHFGYCSDDLQRFCDDQQVQGKVSLTVLGLEFGVSRSLISELLDRAFCTFFFWENIYVASQIHFQPLPFAFLSPFLPSSMADHEPDTPSDAAISYTFTWPLYLNSAYCQIIRQGANTDGSESPNRRASCFSGLAASLVCFPGSLLSIIYFRRRCYYCHNFTANDYP